MGNDRLNGLALLSTHKNMKLHYDAVVAENTHKFTVMRVRLTQ